MVCITRKRKYINGVNHKEEKVYQWLASQRRRKISIGRIKWWESKGSRSISMAKIKRKEDKANCLSLGELNSSQLVHSLVGKATKPEPTCVTPLFLLYLSKCPILSELLTHVLSHKNAFWFRHMAHTLLSSLSNTLQVGLGLAALCRILKARPVISQKCFRYISHCKNCTR